MADAEEPTTAAAPEEQAEEQEAPAPEAAAEEPAAPAEAEPAADAETGAEEADDKPPIDAAETAEDAAAAPMPEPTPEAQEDPVESEEPPAETEVRLSPPRSVYPGWLHRNEGRDSLLSHSWRHACAPPPPPPPEPILDRPITYLLRNHSSSRSLPPFRLQAPLETEEAPAATEASAVPAADDDAAIDALVGTGAGGAQPAASIPGKPLTVRQYLDSTVVPVLRQGLRQLVKTRPEVRPREAILSYRDDGIRPLIMSF